MTEWFIVYLKPRHENKVSEKLAECGLEVFNPKLMERRYLRRKLRDVISPLFPCYIFVRFEIPDEYRLVKYTRGVRSVVGTEGLPTPVPPGIIDAIRARMKEGLVSVRHEMFEPGERVVIKGGPFHDIEAIFVKEMKGIERVSILLREIQARVVVDRALLERA